MSTEDPSPPVKDEEPQGPLRVTWHCDIDAVEKLAPVWKELQERVPGRSVFSTFRWRILWYRHRIPAGEVPVVGIAWRGSQSVGLAPLLLWKGTLGGVPVRRISFAGEQASEGEFLVADADPGVVVGTLVESLRRELRFDVLSLLIHESRADRIAAVERIASREAHASFSRPVRCFEVRDLVDYDEYLKGRSSAFRRNLRSRLRRMQAIGEVRLESWGDGDGEEVLRAAAERFFAVAEASWKLKGGGRIDPMWRAYFLDVILKFGARRELRLYLLTVGGRDVAYFLSVIENQILYDVAVGFDDEFRAMGPGIHLTQEILRVLVRQGVHTLVSHGDHPYKVPWATHARPQREITLVFGSARARLGYFMHSRVKPLLRRLRERGAAPAPAAPSESA